MGKKYIIELEDEPFVNCESSGNILWRVKGFNSLVFDENGLKKLTPYKKEKSSDSDIDVGDVCMIELLDFLFTHPGIVFSFKYNAEDDVFEIRCTTDEAYLESYHIYEMKNVPDLVNNFVEEIKENYDDFERNYVKKKED